jgi:hypothetical protein
MRILRRRFGEEAERLRPAVEAIDSLERLEPSDGSRAGRAHPTGICGRAAARYFIN